jgi:hypothetical protein
MKSSGLVSVFAAFCFFAVAAPALARVPAIPKDEDRFTAYMARRFSDAMPGNKVTVKGPLALEVVVPAGPHDVHLDRIWSFCERDRRRCREQVDGFLANMPGVMLESGGGVKPADIRLVVRTASYVAEMRRLAGDRPDHAGIARPVADDLWMICVVDRPHGVEPLNHGELTKLHLSEDQAIALGSKNVAAALPSLDADTHVVKQIGVKFATGDFYESSRMLLHDSWAGMSKAMGGHLVVAVPNNDFLIYGNGGGNGDRLVLGIFAKDVLKKAPKPISAELFEWTPAGWKVVKP